jgi:hypothetical protein
MRKALLVLAVAASLAGAGAANAGCWATVGLSPLPSEVGAGERWVVDLTVLQHGKTPLADATPSVIVTDEVTGEAATFPARLVSGAEGRYRAEVTFPSSGSWSVAVNDGFPDAPCAQTHTFGSFEIGGPPAGLPPADDGAAPAAAPQAAAPAPSASSAGSSFPVWPVVGGIAGAAAVLAAVLALGRVRARRLA